MKTKARKTRKHIARITEGSRNVFADLGLPNPEQELLKAQLTLQIYTILKASGMTQVDIAKVLGVQFGDDHCRQSPIHTWDLLQ